MNICEGFCATFQNFRGFYFRKFLNFFQFLVYFSTATVFHYIRYIIFFLIYFCQSSYISIKIFFYFIFSTYVLNFLILKSHFSSFTKIIFLLNLFLIICNFYPFSYKLSLRQKNQKLQIINNIFFSNFLL